MAPPSAPAPSFGLDGQVALVTGASRGIGRALCSALAAAGADVGVAVAAEVAAHGRRAHIERLDVTARDQIDGAVTGALAAFGRIDILVNNAGLGPENAAEDVTEEDFDLTCAVNLKGTFFVSQAV